MKFSPGQATPRTKPPRFLTGKGNFDCGEFETVLNKVLQTTDYHGFPTRRIDAATRGMQCGLGIAFSIESAGAPGVKIDPSIGVVEIAAHGICDDVGLEINPTLVKAAPTVTNPTGAKGVGESSIVGALPAFINTVYDALARVGVPHLDMPANPFRVWTALQDAGYFGKAT